MHRFLSYLLITCMYCWLLLGSLFAYADTDETLGSQAIPASTIPAKKGPIKKIVEDLRKLVKPSSETSKLNNSKTKLKENISKPVISKPATKKSPKQNTTEALPLTCDKTINPDTTKTNEICTKPLDTDKGISELTINRPEFELLGHRFKPGEKKRLGWSAGESFAGGSIDSPVLVINGAHPGPKLCLTAAVHGDELNGVEIVLRLVNSIEPTELKGTLIGVPIVNILGLTRGSRYLPDRRDLNRYFPGTTDGSAASRIAYLFFEKVIKHCEFLVDFHTGSGKRTNLPQLRADLNNPDVYEFTQQFGATAVLHHSGNLGMLRRAAIDAGIPAVTFELGEPGTLQIKHVDYGIAAIETLMEKLNMIKRFRLWSEPQPRFYNSTWVRTNDGGVLISKIKLGDTVSKGDKLGWVSNPISNERTSIHASIDGRVLGMALNQFVLPGFAAYHIGVVAKQAPVAQQTKKVGSENIKLISTSNETAPNDKNTLLQKISAIPDPDDPPE